MKPQDTSALRRISTAAWLPAAACFGLLVLSGTSAYGQPVLQLPPGLLPPCPTSGTPTSPCVTVTPTLTPSYFNITFGGLPGGYSITNRAYLGWCADLFGDFNPNQAYTLFNSYSTLPPDS